MSTLSQQIRNCKDGSIGNPYQGSDKKVLFVCSMGLLRSATAARLYASKYNTRSAGTYPDALIPLTPMLLAWADEIVFVNKQNYETVMKKADQEAKRILTEKSKVLNIPDIYPHMHEKLVETFKEQYERI